MKRLILLGILLGLAPGLKAQETFPYNGVADARPACYAFVNATIHQDHNRILENATLVIRKGFIEAVGSSVNVPADAVRIDLKGKHLYPAFIDLYANYGLPEVKSERGQGRSGPQLSTNTPGAYAWNEALKPEFEAHEHFKKDSRQLAEYQKLGFGALLSHHMDGIARGTGTLALLGEQPEHELIVRPRASSHLSFSKGGSTQDYPSSLMGCIALLRQTYYDGRWHAQQAGKSGQNFSLDAWNSNLGLPQIFEVNDKYDLLRAQKIAEEFGVRFVYKAGNDLYQRLAEIKATGAAVILSLEFPDAYDVEDPYDAQSVGLADLKHWELAPFNPGRVSAAGIPLAFTSHGLKKRSEFMAQLRKAIQHGLTEAAALQALTGTPAQILGVEKELGSLDAGKLANFLITDGPIFGKESTILHTWIKGEPHIWKELDEPQFSGRYQLKLHGNTYALLVKGKPEKPEMVLQINDSTELKVQHKLTPALITLSFTLPGESMAVRLSGQHRNTPWSGRGQLANGDWIDWQASYEGPLEEADKKPEREKTEEIAEPGEVWYPFLPYGWLEAPVQEWVMIQNATLWTNEAEGVLEGADIILRNGKIVQVGQGLTLPRGALLVDGTGKHVTPGIIDEHSHIAISRGVNEGTHASTAEVRIGDVINSDDVNIYRQLAGGVTSTQLLHGSANPIGGQAALIKLRWGYLPEQMKFEGAPGFIKFALGENVKQSNWGDLNRVRFPQSRMGVEQVYIDRFSRAREYGILKRSGKPYRVDLELEALLEILESQRFITCHSYRQSEINMLMHVADQFGFRVNTFTHILEGYKVADKMAAHGAGGSSFSDWWAYKYEVWDAIPYNGALMFEQGVTVAFNSDDAEMARRLNQEAAKAVQYGGVPEEEALKFVTLNPARLLQVDKRVGSLKPGKDADVVLWSGHPLSVYSVAEMTFVDGIRFYDRSRDEALREAVAAERHRLIQKMLAVKKGGGKTQSPRPQREHHYHCDDVHDEGNY
jgi:imidazolonepropionase-like amidohydrolase